MAAPEDVTATSCATGQIRIYFRKEVKPIDYD
jgi:hypothetical protein